MNKEISSMITSDEKTKSQHCYKEKLINTLLTFCAGARHVLKGPSKP